MREPYLARGDKALIKEIMKELQAMIDGVPPDGDNGGLSTKMPKPPKG